MKRPMSLKDDTIMILVVFLTVDCLQRHLTTAQLVTAGTYYQEIKGSSGSKTSSNDVPVLTAEMFRCSREAGCGTIGKKKNAMVLEEIRNSTNRSGYDEIIEKRRSGELNNTMSKL